MGEILFRIACGLVAGILPAIFAAYSTWQSDKKEKEASISSGDSPRQKVQ